jgi:hypothetical protein
MPFPLPPIEGHTKGPVVHKWLNYFDVYHRYFEKYRDKPVHFLEIGVQSGGSMKMWQAYFTHPDARFYGIEINPYAKALYDCLPRVQIFTGSQSDRAFLQSVITAIPKLDIVLDDGGHSMSMQITSFEELYDHVQPHGIYMVEYVATSYNKGYGGNFKASSSPADSTISFIDYSNLMVDRLNAFSWDTATSDPVHAQAVSDIGPKKFTHTTTAIGFYDQIVVFEKGKHLRPKNERHGTFSFGYALPLATNGSLDMVLLQRLEKELKDSELGL